MRPGEPAGTCKINAILASPRPTGSERLEQVPPPGAARGPCAPWACCPPRAQLCSAGASSEMRAKLLLGGSRGRSGPCRIPLRDRCRSLSHLPAAAALLTSPGPRVLRAPSAHWSTRGSLHSAACKRAGAGLVRAGCCPKAPLEGARAPPWEALALRGSGRLGRGRPASSSRSPAAASSFLARTDLLLTMAAPQSLTPAGAGAPPLCSPPGIPVGSGWFRSCLLGACQQPVLCPPSSYLPDDPAGRLACPSGPARPNAAGAGGACPGAGVRLAWPGTATARCASIPGSGFGGVIL